ncbi:L-lactate dehydrogenase [Novipirellula aureliae]|uniref:L-lactate dehydrogenase n=1 Tax=Novipirellula aureliae TaxID=2527966 RepID=A0A5C6DZ07_9BACT|nr:L-lactate dehydrogenase [Novipirellula aureliae]TWU40306.1 L-lactate dehydrogenase [Novipirellula aureliae]
MKIGIVGTGMVGSTAAYALVMRGIGSEIVLVDQNKSRSSAEANDILHAIPFAHPLDIFSGDYSDLAKCRVVIIAAGVSQKPGESRLELLQRNADVFRQVVPKVLEAAKDAVIVVATNPVDIMTHMASHFAGQMGVSANRVLGSGTTLDTARFRALLGRHLDVDAQHVHAYVVGEHGDSEVLSWSSVTIAGLSLEEFCEVRNLNLSTQDRRKIEQNVRQAAYQIIQGKGATYYGIGSALARIVSAILNDQRAILTVCGRVEKIGGVSDVTIALPHLIDGNGLVDLIPQTLNEQEMKALEVSAAVIRNAIDSIHID